MGRGEQLGGSLPEMHHVALGGFTIDVVLDFVNVDGIFVAQIMENIVRRDGRRTGLFASEYQVNPFMQVF